MITVKAIRQFLGKQSRFGLESPSPLLLTGWCLFIFILSSVPGNQYPQVSWNLADKVVHVALYLILGFLAARCFTTRGYSWYVPVAFGILFGITDELHQAWVPMRSPSVADVYADAIGVTLGVCTFTLVQRLTQRQTRIAESDLKSRESLELS